MDVGCGTGFLSMLAVKAGAKHVYAIEMSDMADQAIEMIASNGFSDKITVIKKRVEEVNMEIKIDIIVSEWMGYCLFYEAMFDSVIFARDNFLNNNGIMIPNIAEFYVAAVLNQQNSFENVAGLNLNKIAA